MTEHIPMQPLATTEPAPLRPLAITRCALFLLVGAAIGLVQAINARIEQGTLAAGVAEASKYMNEDQANYVTAGLRGSLGLAWPAGVTAVVVGIGLAPMIMRGKRWARVGLWGAGGLLIIAEMVLAASDSVVTTGNYVRDVDVPGGDLTIVAMINHLLVPGWFFPVYYLTEFAILVCLAAAVVHSVLPSASEYFRVGPQKYVEDQRAWSVTGRPL
jgi:hypothetical protein